MLICEDGLTIGSLSGGCLEEEVAVEARAVLAGGIPKLISFDTRRRFGCNGRIEIFIEHVSEGFFADVGRLIEQRVRCTIATVFASFSAEEGGDGCRAEWTAQRAVPTMPVSTLGSRTISALEGEDGSFPYRAHEDVALVQEVHPPLRLLVFGDGSDSKPIRQLCEILGWIVIDVLDATAVDLQADPWTAALVKSHNYGRDFAALEKLLPLDLRYVGLIGPRKRRDQLLNELLDVGIPINAGFFAPAGLDLGVETPEEIALSIVGEMQHVFAGGTGVSLRERKSPIHIAQSRPETECEVPLP
jgi:xanthine/CO dehydrogenase XdhC/CoxF family maturation factor